MTRSIIGIVGFALIVLTGAGTAIASPEKAAMPDPNAALDRLAAAAKPVMLTFNERSVADVFLAVEQASGVHIMLMAVPERKVSIRTGEVPLKDALIQLARENDLVYEVIGTDRLVVRSAAKSAS